MSTCALYSGSGIERLKGLGRGRTGAGGNRRGEPVRHREAVATKRPMTRCFRSGVSNRPSEKSKILVTSGENKNDHLEGFDAKIIVFWATLSLSIPNGYV